MKHIARNSAKKNAGTGKKLYDRKLFGATLEVGDRVLVRNQSERGGTGKLRSYWEENVHVVVSKKDDRIPVYVVKAENGTGKERVRHRNLLLPCDHLPLEIPEEEEEEPPVEAPKPKKGKKKTSVPSPDAVEQNRTSKKKKKVSVVTPAEEEELASKKKKKASHPQSSVADESDSSSDEDEWLQNVRKAIDVLSRSQFDPATEPFVPETSRDVSPQGDSSVQPWGGDASSCISQGTLVSLDPIPELEGEDSGTEEQHVEEEETVPFAMADNTTDDPDEFESVSAGSGAEEVLDNQTPLSPFVPDAESTLLAAPDESVEYLDALDYSFEDTALQQLCESLQNSVEEDTVVAEEVDAESSLVSDPTQQYDESVVDWNPAVDDENTDADADSDAHADAVPPPPPPPAAATSSEDEVDLSTFRRERRSKRRVIVPSRLTYDRPGKPSMRRNIRK